MHRYRCTDKIHLCICGNKKMNSNALKELSYKLATNAQIKSICASVATKK
jgi:hypothetical protein